MEKDILQSLKLEISRNFTLAPYERIAFHKILTYQKSDNGLRVLLRDILKGGIIRKSAISVVKDFPHADVANTFVELLVTSDNLEREEFNDILEHLEKFGKKTHVAGLIEYITRSLDKTEKAEHTARTIFVLGNIGSGSTEAVDLIKSIIINPEMFERVRSAAIESFVHAFDVELMESVLRENNDHLACSVYRAIAEIADREMIHYESSSEDEIFTVMPGQEDRVLLDIRVLLGKMSPSFDKYSRETKGAYIMAMILSGHREFIIYTMKALTSNDPELIDQTLYVILSNTGKLRVPDKLLRSLISLPSVTLRDTRIIVDIFNRFFSLLKDSRNNMMFRDKIFNYLIVTLDAYFETYRKNFMIPEIMEKDHLPDVQVIRSLVLNRFNPDIKRRIIMHLRSEDRAVIKKIIGEISESVSFIPDEEDEVFHRFIEMLYDKDVKTREISAARIDDIDYEKRYMKNRIVRICEIIARLNIDEASANLVKMFNYVKKYYDSEIYATVTQTLSALNYPYMLSELEVQLASGDVVDQKRAVQLLPFYNDQRSLNIMLDYVKEHASESSEVMSAILKVLVKREAAGNIAANEIAKLIVRENKDPLLKRSAIHIIGNCGLEKDIVYLNELFGSESDAGVKETILQAFDMLMQITREFDKQKIISIFKEYMKDPGIRVRMYACAILLKLGHQDALVSIREMMIIKNRQIQRDILLILGNLMTAEIAFFLISLLKEDYAIAADIIPLLRFLRQEELTEIDHFVINLFKKYEGVNLDGVSGAQHQTLMNTQEIKGYKRETVSLLMLEIMNFNLFSNDKVPSEMILVFKRGYQRIIEILSEGGGSISRTTAGKMIATFPEVVSAASAATKIMDSIHEFNNSIPHEFNLQVMLFVTMNETDMVFSEVILPDEREFSILRSAPIENRIFLSSETFRIAERSFRCGFLPDPLFHMTGTSLEFKELISHNNFIIKAEAVIKSLDEDELHREEAQRLIESGGRQDLSSKRSKNTIAFSNAMEHIGKTLRHDLVDVSKYIGKRSVDRELIKSTEKMLDDVYRHYMLQVSKTIIE
jgi:hypothetical protein